MKQPEMFSDMWDLNHKLIKTIHYLESILFPAPNKKGETDCIVKTIEIDKYLFAGSLKVIISEGVVYITTATCEYVFPTDFILEIKKRMKRMQIK